MKFSLRVSQRRVLGAALAMGLCGALGAARGQDATPAGAADGAAATASGSAAARFVAEVDRELGSAASTHYSHKTHVDEGDGEFDLDCSGFVVYALGHAVPEAVKPLKEGSKHKRPLAEDFVRVLEPIRPGEPRGSWQRVARVRDLEPGDVVAWRVTDEQKAAGNKNSGHVMIVHGAVRVSARDPHELLVPVADSTVHGHAADSRPTDGSGGLGTGTIGLEVDDDGAPLAYLWSGGISRKAVKTTIVLGRLR